jgi:hypothetical protein
LPENFAVNSAYYYASKNKTPEDEFWLSRGWGECGLDLGGLAGGFGFEVLESDGRVVDRLGFVFGLLVGGPALIGRQDVR